MLETEKFKCKRKTITNPVGTMLRSDTVCRIYLSMGIDIMQHSFVRVVGFD